jgi:hypothetical protein
MDPFNNVTSSTAKPGFSVKPCTGPYMDKSVASINNSQSLQRNFFNSLGKIGDVSILDSITGGSIGLGLRTLASASNSIRTGCGSLPTSIGSTLESGANWVLNSIGIAPAIISALHPFHPGVANHAVGQAQQLFEQIQQGHFKATDIPNYISGFQNLEQLLRGIYTPGNDRVNSLTPRCEASPYAIDLLARSPKYKFLFVVQFVLDAGYSSLQNQLNGMAFVVKKTSRPTVKFLSDDVNYYNFRTKVITKTEFEEMTMSFHDDGLNNTHSFYTACIQALSPISNNSQWIAPDLLETMGMNFNKDKINYSASLGTLFEDSKQTIFKEIILYHVFDWGNKTNIYHFYNPRISQLQPDDLDMTEGSSLSELSMTFNYDYVYIETVDASTVMWEDLQPGAVYPLRYNDSASSIIGPNQSGLNPYGTPFQVSGQNCGIPQLNTSSLF